MKPRLVQAKSYEQINLTLSLGLQVWEERSPSYSCTGSYKYGHLGQITGEAQFWPLKGSHMFHMPLVEQPRCFWVEKQPQ